ncbi:MAG: hypothetical protein EBS89_02850, partial [Proteobacteria bacterium]|nr:hypothetical protein [Pseudomonadota bacterium]
MKKRVRKNAVPLNPWLSSNAASSDPVRLSGTITIAHVKVRVSDGQKRRSPPWIARRKLSNPTNWGARMMLYCVNA